MNWHEKKKALVKGIVSILLLSLTSISVQAKSKPSLVETEAYIEGFVSKYTRCVGSEEHVSSISVKDGKIDYTRKVYLSPEQYFISKAQISILDVGELEIFKDPDSTCSSTFLSCSGRVNCVKEQRLKGAGLPTEERSDTTNFLAIDTSADLETLQKLVRALKHYNGLHGGVLTEGFDEDKF